MNEFYNAMIDLTSAQREYEIAENDYRQGGGCSWGYAGQRYEDRLYEAQKRFEKAFRDAVLEVVQTATVKPPPGA